MRDQLKELLYQTARERARRRGYDFTSILDQDLRTFINQGVDRMDLLDILSGVQNPRAITNTEVLIDRMIVNAQSRNLNESLDYKSFNNVRDSICPLWPFC